MPDLSINLCGIKMKNVIMLGSGPRGGSSGQGMKTFAEAGWGAVLSKTCSVDPQKGHPKPQIKDYPPYYMINAQGGPNPGYIKRAKEVEFAKTVGVPIIASIGADNKEDFIMMANEFAEAGADAIELNMSCSHSSNRSNWTNDKEAMRVCIKAVKDAIDIPLWVKLPSTRIIDIPILAQTVEQGGADAVIPFNNLPATMIDIETGKPVLGNPNGIGSISGKAVKPVALRCVLDAARVVNIPVIGTGGVDCGEDIIEFLMVGASAVQIHTLPFRDGPGVIDRLLNEIEEFMNRKGYKSIDEIIGLTLKYVPEKPFQIIDEQI